MATTTIRRSPLWQTSQHSSGRVEIPDYCSTTSSHEDSSSSDRLGSTVGKSLQPPGASMKDLSDTTQERRQRLQQMRQHHHEQSMRSLCPQEDAPATQPLDNSKSGSLTGLLGSFIGSYQGSVSSFNDTATSVDDLTTGSNHSGKSTSVMSVFRLKTPNGSKSNWDSEASLEVDLLPEPPVKPSENKERNPNPVRKSRAVASGKSTRERELSPRISRKERRHETEVLHTTSNDAPEAHPDERRNVKRVKQRTALQRTRSADLPSRPLKRDVRRSHSGNGPNRPSHARSHRSTSPNTMVGNDAISSTRSSREGKSRSPIRRTRSTDQSAHSPPRRISRSPTGTTGPSRRGQRGQGSAAASPNRLPRRALSGTPQTRSQFPSYRRTGSHNDVPQRPRRTVSRDEDQETDQPQRNASRRPLSRRNTDK